MSPRSRMPSLLLAFLLAVPTLALAAPAVNSVFAYENYVSPNTAKAGETSIGVDPYTNSVLFQHLFTTDRLDFDFSTNPPTMSYADVTPPYQLTTFDPIMYTDRVSGKTYVDHNMELFDDLFFTIGIPGQVADGDNWVQVEPASHFPFFDHQTLGSGPHTTIPDPNGLGVDNRVTGNLNAMYTCGQLGTAVCMRSDDDGITWGPYTIINAAPDTCGGLFGHVVVDHAGVVYVPNKNCGGNGQGIEHSTNDGVTWTTAYVPGSIATNSDMQLAVDGGDTTWAAFRNGGNSGGKLMVSKTTNHGTSWSTPVDVSPGLAYNSARFPMITAGDAGRVAVAYYGAFETGDDQAGSYNGVYHLYVATTIDNGATWTTVDVTPNDPVQRGCIWMNGGGNACRNLLDFQGMTYDNQGRVVIGYADGCISAKCIGSTGLPADSRASQGYVALQTSGPHLLAGFG